METKSFLHPVIMRILIIATFLLLAAITSHAQGRQTSRINDAMLLVKEMAGANKYESQYVGFAGTQSVQYKRMQALSDKVTETELRQLTRHGSAVVRIYSYIILKRKYPKVAKKIREQLMKDDTPVFVFDGCIGGRSTVQNIIRKF